MRAQLSLSSRRGSRREAPLGSMDAPSEAGRLAAAFAEGGAEEREAAYRAIEDVVRAESDSGRGGGGHPSSQAIAVAAGC